MTELCVVFDIDDTLYLEREYVCSGFEAVGEWVRSWLNIPDFAKRCRRAHQAGTRGSVFNRVLEECGAGACPETIAALVAIYRAHIPDIHFCRDALEAISEARNRWPVAVITDGPAISQSRKAGALQLDRFASPILLTELYGRECSKPSPVAFRKVEQTIGAKQFVYVADNPAKDFTAPQMLGWRSVRIRRPEGLHFHMDNPAASPDAELPDCARLIPLLLDLV